MKTVPKENIKALECKHAVYVTSNNGDRNDLVVVKEVIHTKDGQLVPNIRFFPNYKRPFYVTRELHRNHEEKKEWEKKSKLQEFKCRQIDLVPAIAKALNMGNIQGGLRIAARSKYLYGADITTPTLIKQMYRDKFPNVVSLNTVAVFDIETDVVNGTNLPILLALTFKDKAILVATEEFMGTLQKPEQKIQEMFEKHLGKIKKERNINLEFKIVKTAGQGIVEIFKKAHEWKPDFVAIWNIDFDIPKCIETLTLEGIDPAEVFSDPSVPDEYKYFKYKKGPTTKTTARGLVMSIHVAERWNYVICPASFFLIDSMCVYKRIRLAKQNEPSYKLDYILNKHLKLGKLSFDIEGVPPEGTLQWHQFMQTYHKLEYGIYNLFDCISVEMLDEKTKDLCQIISTQSKASEYTIYNAQTKRLVDDLYFFCRDRDLVPASCSDSMKVELDAFTPSKEDWIVTLPSHLTIDNGLKLLEELPDVRSLCRVHVADLDIVSTYPNVQKILNMSKETTHREIFKISNVPLYKQRMAGINLTGGFVNAVEIVCDLYNAPNFNTILEDFNNTVD